MIDFLLISFIYPTLFFLFIFLFSEMKTLLAELFF